jgi:hypothetical protein
MLDTHGAQTNSFRCGDCMWNSVLRKAHKLKLSSKNPWANIIVFLYLKAPCASTVVVVAFNHAGSTNQKFLDNARRRRRSGLRLA